MSTYQSDQPASKASGHGSPSDSGKSKSGLLAFFKGSTQSSVAQANEPKRRGPKPDTKPALTRRQQLNRQAQRTHRERKELYIKALEQEVLRLKENFSNASRDKDSLAEENRQLRLLLAQNGIQWTGTGGVDEYTRRTSNGYTSSTSISGTYAPGSAGYSPSSNKSNLNSASPTSLSVGSGGSANKQQLQVGVDYEQVGIDFVLALERPCKLHMQYLSERSAGPEGHPCGHALMATCPPVPFPSEETPFGHLPTYIEQTWDICRADLANLLDLSRRLDLDGEVTPVMAWGMVLGHPRFSELRTVDLDSIRETLGAKIRCYGFGAVVEEFEAQDAIESVFSLK